MANAIRRRVLVAALALAIVAGACAKPAPGRDGAHASASATAPPPRGVFGASRFFAGAWCSPPTTTTDRATWERFARAGLSVAVRPLEDTNDRARNLATLSLLDSLAPFTVPDSVLRQFPAPVLMARDNAVQPDEPARAGWRDRVREVVAAYRGHRSLAGYFIADEPRPADFDRIALLTAAFAQADSVHPAYVNLLPIAASATAEEQVRWREDVTRLIQRGRLRLFTFDAYSQRRQGEDASLLLTLGNAARVSRETGCPFGVVLQFTGFGPLDPMRFADLDYAAAEAVAHGASGIIWFTYWTPNPREPGMAWRGGAVEYDGRWTARGDSMNTVNNRAAMFADWFAGQRTRVMHSGGSMPRGASVASEPIEGLASVDGGPVTVASVDGGEPPSDRTWLVINRDRGRARRITLMLARTLAPHAVLGPFRGAGLPARSAEDERGVVVLDLGPGESALLELGPR